MVKLKKVNKIIYTSIYEKYFLAYLHGYLQIKTAMIYIY